MLILIKGVFLQGEHALIKNIIDEIETVVIGKREKITLALSAFLAGGHLLIEDLPGVGKTTLAKVFSKVLGLDFNRIQFTSDLLPSDIIGVEYYDIKGADFHFKKGPIFTSVLLADEINRASSKTQSALLEAMAEHQVSIDNHTHQLPYPFFVIATKNPFEEAGVFKMPSSQLDRFIATLSLGYADPINERAILKGEHLLNLDTLKSFETSQILALIKKRETVYLNDEILDRIQSIVTLSRETTLFKYGLSTRGALALVQMSKAYALIQNRDYVIPDDVDSVLACVVHHRLETLSDASKTAHAQILALL